MAAVGRLTAHATLRSDLQAAAVVWACYSPDMTEQPIIKSYTWYVRPDTLSVMLQKIYWTSYEEDPCRVELNQPLSFQGSRAAVAFSRDGQTLWTPGGAHNLETGAREYPPPIFDDPHLSDLTFSRVATAFAGVREGSGLEIHAVQGAMIIATALGPTEHEPIRRFLSLPVLLVRKWIFVIKAYNRGSRSFPGSLVASSRSGVSQCVWGPYSKNGRTADMQ